jgi:hypothetical protein
MARLRARSSLWGESADGSESANDLAVLESDPVRSRGGTRFRLFPQPPFLKHYRKPVTVRLSPRRGSVGPGPADARMYVVEPVGKQRPYGIVPGPFGSAFLYLPTWDGLSEPPALPDADGNFDSVEIGTPQFDAAHVYGCVRWTLDIWERHFRRQLEWHFAADYRSLEISLYPDFDNSTAGYGFLEVGADLSGGKPQSFGNNFDVVAHETGHLIIYSLLGVPDIDETMGEYRGFHESAADLVAMIAAANFDPVLDELFANTRGNLYVTNELNRFAELSEQTQIRLASNIVKMSAFREGWSDEHMLALPLTGAIFDILCDIYHRLLIERGLIDSELVRLVDEEHRLGENEARIQAKFDGAYQAGPARFRACLCHARELLGQYLAETWQRLTAGNFSYAVLADIMLEVDRELGGGRFREAIASSFRWREIGEVVLGPRLPRQGEEQGSHLHSARTVLPRHARSLPRMSYRERWMLARGG